MGIVMHRGAVSSTVAPPAASGLDTSASQDCTYSRLYPGDAAGKSYERPAYHEPKSTYHELSRTPGWVSEPIKYNADVQSKSYEAAKASHEATKYHEAMVHKYPELPGKSYELPKYPEAKVYPEMAGPMAGKSYACVHTQYYSPAEGYAMHEENEYQPQSVPAHSFYPYISASMAQPPYYMGPR